MNSKNKIVMFNGARQHSFSAQKDCLVTLNAGSNVVSIEKLNRLLGETGDEKLDAMKSDSFIDMVMNDVIKIIDGDGVKKAIPSEVNSDTGIKIGADIIEVNIVELGGKEAVTIINSEIDVDKLKVYLEDEVAQGDDARKTVVKAAEKAIAALESIKED